MNITVKCPTCEKPVEWNDNFPDRPFCSERCKLIDLGAWADETHRVPGDTTQEFEIFPYDENETID